MNLCEIEVREDLNFLEREWVIGRLVSKAGVQEALARPDDPRKLVVEYDADLVDTSDLLEFLQMCGLQADATPLLHSDRSEALTSPAAGAASALPDSRAWPTICAR